MSATDDITSELTPEQILGSLIIQASHGEYTNWVSRRSWEIYGDKVNFDALRSVFEEYLEKKQIDQTTTSSI